MARRKRKKKGTAARRRALWLGGALLVLLVVWGSVAEWFVHHPPDWIARQSALVAAPLLWLGNPVADITDGLGWTGYDTVHEYDTEAPSGSVVFAGPPSRQSAPAPDDIRVLDRGEFLIGWSDRLRHPVWCAYHVVRDAKFENGKRPGFTKDPSVLRAPAPGDYTNSGYDRGHMAPNHAIETRYGTSEQKKTFQMSNIAPQSAALNRGVWRDFEHRIADLWTERYGEIWVIVGCISPVANGKTVGKTDIDVPTEYYQLILAQENMDVRALAVLFRQDVPWNAWAARHIVTIRELEARTGLDFNPELPSFFQEQIETDRPSRLWPVRFRDIFSQIALRFR